MAKVTSKLQVTVPKALADRYHIEPGAEIEWEAAGDAIRVIPARRRRADPASRLKLFDKATARQRERERSAGFARASERGWSREDLYERGRPR
jgi:bifunctional DNA-binding transcriptional regulator/antitoxin component of YhaV-PrlF toxin-antitoxin module